jgi:hypothetical protein
MFVRAIKILKEIFWNEDDVEEEVCITQLLSNFPGKCIKKKKTVLFHPRNQSSMQMHPLVTGSERKKRFYIYL